VRLRLPPRPPRPPAFLERRHTDEFVPPALGPAARRARARTLEHARRAAPRLALPLGEYLAGRLGTAAGLRALNAEAGETFYRVPPEAELDPAAAADALGGGELVIDVQTHYVANRALPTWERAIADMYRRIGPTWWRGVDELVAYDLAEYLRCVFLDGETAVAVLTSGPGIHDHDRMLFDRELAGTRELCERLGGGGRLLNHCVVHPDVPGELDRMGDALARFRPVGWKCYTIATRGGTQGAGWWLDDEATGVPFLERARALGPKLVCAHKGISAMVPAGSPRDVGPVARAFPELRFVIYHSGWEFPAGEAPEEGPWTEATAHAGVNRLVTSLRDAGLRPGANAYAELGSTWFGLIRRPREAAHVLGKLLLAVGEDNLIWGTDAIWYGPSQVALDAFRAFQIPAWMRERWGYPELTPRLKAKVLGLNAARVYGIDPEQARQRARGDDLAWARAALAEFRATGVPGA
jgi:hypothetical protein